MEKFIMENTQEFEYMQFRRKVNKNDKQKEIPLNPQKKNEKLTLLQSKFQYNYELIEEYLG